MAQLAKIIRNLGFGRPGLNPFIAEFVASEILIL
jgi:hypothetical protein